MRNFCIFSDLAIYTARMGINADVQGGGGIRFLDRPGQRRGGVYEGPEFADVFCVCPPNHVDDDDDPTLILK